MMAPEVPGLSQNELQALVAEIDVDDHGVTTVPPVEHVKTWVAVIYELRDHTFYGYFLQTGKTL